MQEKHRVLELPVQNEGFDKIISDPKHSVRHVAFSSVVVDGAVKHFALIVWHDEEYGDHEF